jgi:CRISPR/Cas system CMR-associated protein Cmr5 small subunit
MNIGIIGTSDNWENSYLSADKKNSESLQSTSDTFQMLKEKFMEENKLNKENRKDEDDWRTMSDDQWDKLVEHIDTYIDEYKEDLEKRKELQQEAAMKGAANAPAYRRTNAAASAALKAVSNGIAEGGQTERDETELEKMSWTYGLETDDQTVLTAAKMANEYAHRTLLKSQELALTGDTSVGITQTDDTKECAVFDESGEKKTWTVTAFTEQGIICTEWTDGVSREIWRIDYKNSGDCKKVWDFLDQLDQDADWKFAGDKSFWEEFLAS